MKKSTLTIIVVVVLTLIASNVMVMASPVAGNANCVEIDQGGCGGNVSNTAIVITENDVSVKARGGCGIVLGGNVNNIDICQNANTWKGKVTNIAQVSATNSINLEKCGPGSIMGGNINCVEIDQCGSGKKGSNDALAITCNDIDIKKKGQGCIVAINANGIDINQSACGMPCVKAAPKSNTAQVSISNSINISSKICGRGR